MSGTLVIYRNHYGTDFFAQSIKTLYNNADAIYVGVNLLPWNIPDDGYINYLGKRMRFPPNPDSPLNLLEYLITKYNKIGYKVNTTLSGTPKGEFANIYKNAIFDYNKYFDYVAFIEPDMVLPPNGLSVLISELQAKDLECIGTHQVELWKGPNYRVPQRDRIGIVVYDVKKWLKEFFNKPGYTDNFWENFPTTSFGPYLEGKNIPISNVVQNYNMGFCVRDEVMWYKHICAIVNSAKIGDSIPDERWYLDKWMLWKPETEDLEIAKNYKHMIKKAEPYSMSDKMKEIIFDFD